MAYAGEKVVTIEARFKGAQTQAEIEKLARLARDVRKNEIIGSQEFTKAAKLEADIKNKLHSLNVQAYSDNAKMKESYFSLGQQLRHNKFAMMELAQAAGFDRGGLGGVLMAFTGPGGVVTGLLAASALLVSSFVNQKKEAKDTTRDINTLADAYKGLADAQSKFDEARIAGETPQQKKSRIQSRISQLNTPSTVAAHNIMPWGGVNVGTRTQDTLDAAELLRLRKELADVEKQITEENTKQSNEVYKEAESTRQRTLMFGGKGSLFAPQGAGGSFGAGFGRRPMPRSSADIQGAATQNTAGLVQPEKIDQTFSRITQAANQAGMAINNSITGSLVKALDTGSELADQLLSIALQLGLSFIPGVGGFLGGTLGTEIFDDTNHSRASGGSSGGSFSGIARSARASGGGGMRAPIVLGFKLGLTDLAIGVERGGNLRKGGVLR